jgi:GntR family transcriptional regulator
MEDPATTPLGGTARTVYETLRARIDAGRYTPTGRLPSERSLASELTVSRGSLRQALARLATDGMISASPQSGWHVMAAPLGEPPHTLISFTEMARRRGLDPRTRVLTHTVRAANLDEADQLRVPPASPVLELERVRSLSDVPVCLDHNVISLHRIPALADAELTDRSLYEQLVALGARPHRSDFTVQACGADERTARHLGVETGAPILLGVELCADPGGRPLLLGRSRFRGDSYRFQATLFRRG